MSLFQADVARAVEFGEMTVHRALKALDRSGRPFTAEDAQAVFCVSELQALGMTAAAAGELLGSLSSELRFVLKSPANRCWIVFASGTPRPCASLRHLEALLDANPMSLTLPLHELAARAAERLQRLESAKEAA
ncbi:hypothetical protein [Agrobacterium rosae]|uniref:hypothetical protein n=1 Tax=Agrobacterium rosae TaxID=1972867 RepID=UPI00203442A4|nr:hypothetical protein [Agrobacterium rosae]MCM2435365.1 hypothetical protein [Agrobacterium rosae]